MEIAAERATTAQEGQPSSVSFAPFTPTDHLRSGFLSFTEFLLRHVEEWSKPSAPWPLPPPPITFSGSDRFIKGRLPHRTVAISASLSSLFDDLAAGDLHAAKGEKMTRDDNHSKMHDVTHGDNDRVSEASTQCNSFVNIVSTDNAQTSNEADDAVQALSANMMVDVSACITDTALEVNAACACPKDGSSVSTNEIADVTTCDTDSLLPADPQNPHRSDDVIGPNLHEDDGWIQRLNKVGTPGISANGVYVPDDPFPDKTCLFMKHKEGCSPLSENSSRTLVVGDKVVTKTLADESAEHSPPLECKSFLRPSILKNDVDEVAELPLPSLSKSPNNNLTGHMGGAMEVSSPFRTKSDNHNTTEDADGSIKFSSRSPRKSHNDNKFTGSFPSLSKGANDNNFEGDVGVVSDLSLPSTNTTMSPDNNNTLKSDADRVIQLSSPSLMKSIHSVTQDTEELAQHLLLSPVKIDNAENLTGNVETVTELPPTRNCDVNISENTVMEAPVVLWQDEEVEDLEEGELFERFPGDICLEMSKDGEASGEGENHSFNATRVESKALESTTDDEMNQPISLFIARYRTRSSFNTSTPEIPPLAAVSNIKMKRKTGNKRKIQDQEQVLKEKSCTDMAVAGKVRQAKGVRKGPSKVARACARVLNDYNGGQLGVTSKLSVVSKIDMSEAKDDLEKKHTEFEAAQTGRDQVMGTPAVVLSEKEDGALRTHGNGLTQHGLAGSEHFVALENSKVCSPIVVEEGLSTIDAGNAEKSSQAEVAMKKPKRVLTKERKKKKQKIKHRKANERQARKLRLKPCVDKEKEKKPCHFYVRGKCSKGRSCSFPHNVTPITKSEACRYFISNCCLRGDDCPYSHALSTFPCKFFHMRGKCKEAGSCRFSHEPISEEARQKLLAKVEEEQQVREGNKVTESDGLGHTNPKHSVLPYELELFPLGRKHANKTLLKGMDASSKKLRLDTTGTSSTCNNIGEATMLVSPKKVASMFTGGVTSINAASLKVNKSLFRNGSLDRAGPLPDKSSKKSTSPTTKSTGRESEGLLQPPAGFSSDSTMMRERKTKVDTFLQAQLDNSHLLRKSKLGTGWENFGGCYTLVNQPRELSKRQTSLFKAPDVASTRDPNDKAMGLLHASTDCHQLICVDTKSNSNVSIESVSQGKSVGIETSVLNPSVLGPSLLDIFSMSQRDTVPKGLASTSGLFSTTMNATPKRSTANVFLDRFLKG